MPATDRFNLVLLPLAEGLYQLSANSPGYKRLVSPAWTEAQLRTACAPIPAPQLEELFRGNRMVHGGRNPSYVFYSESALTAMGLSPVPERILAV